MPSSGSWIEDSASCWLDECDKRRRNLPTMPSYAAGVLTRRERIEESPVGSNVVRAEKAEEDERPCPVE